jgi:hypothetical protein
MRRGAWILNLQYEPCVCEGSEKVFLLIPNLSDVISRSLEATINLVRFDTYPTDFSLPPEMTSGMDAYGDDFSGIAQFGS